MVRHFLLFLGLCAGPAFAQDETLTAARRWAVVIGNSEYDFLPDLKFARDDAKEVARALIEEHGFAADTVRLLTDDAEDEFKRPTRAYVMRELRSLLADPRRTPSDLFVFYFSGHGVGLADGDYLLPQGADIETVADVGLNVREVVGVLREEGVANALFVMDGCREGEKNTPFGRWLLELPDDERVAVLLSCEPGQQSLQSRRLGHGIFTWYFVQALRDDSAYDAESGALWASRVGARVSAQVAQHTELETVPQVPLVFVDDTRDVLLGTRIPAALHGERLTEWADAIGRSVDDPVLYMGAIGAYAEHLGEAGDYATCAAVLTAGAERGTLPPHLQYFLAMSLALLDRDREAARAFASLRRDHADNYYGRLAAVQDFSGAAPATERRAAALAMIEHDQPLPDEIVSDLAIVLLRTAAQDEALAAVEQLAASRAADNRVRAYLEALVAHERGDVGAALEAFARAEVLAGYPQLDLVRTDYASALARAGRGRDALAVLTRGHEAEPTRAFWLARRAWQWRELGEIAPARKDARAALALALDADDLLRVVHVLGADSWDHVEQITEQAARHPLAWQARVAEIVASSRGGRVGGALWDDRRYAASDVQIVVGAAEVVLDISAEQLARGRIDAQADHATRVGVLGELVRRAGEFGADAEPWGLLDRVATDMGLFTQMRELCDRHLAPSVERGDLPALLAVMYALVSLNTGDLERFRELLAVVGRESRYGTDLAWFEVAYLATRAETEAARERMRDLPAPSSGFVDLVPLLGALLAAQEGDGEAAIALLGEVTPGGQLADTLAAQTLFTLGRPDLAEPLIRQLAASVGTPFSFAEVACLHAFVRTYGDESARLEFAQRCAKYYPGNPLVRTVSFAPELGTAAFAGILRLRLAGPLEGGKILLVFEEDGSVEGSVRLPDKRNLSVEGRLDEYGNLAAELVDGESRMCLLAKLAPPAVYADHEGLKLAGQLLLVVDEQGCMSGWVALP